MFILKEIGTKSAELLAELCATTFIQAYEDTHSKKDIDTYCNRSYSADVIRKSLGLDSVRAVVAFQNSEPAGFYVIKHHPCPIKLTGKSTELKQIYVLSSHFGAGLGRTLFDSAVDQALNNSSQWFWLCVSDINYRAQAFYKKLGFSHTGKGPKLIVGKDTLSSSILTLNIGVKKT